MTTTKLNNKETSGILDRKYEMEVNLNGTSGRLLGVNKTLDKNRVLLGPQQENVKNWCKKLVRLITDLQKERDEYRAV